MDRISTCCLQQTFRYKEWESVSHCKADNSSFYTESVRSIICKGGNMYFSLFFGYFTLPVLFILHDFEEMILVPFWKRTNRFQKNPRFHHYFGNTHNGAIFSIGVLEEFLILLLISALCSITENRRLYLCFLLAYSFHFLIHLKMCVSYHGYVPGIITCLLQLPMMVILIRHYFTLDFPTCLLFILTMFIVYGNLLLMHRLMPKWEAQLNRIWD